MKFFDFTTGLRARRRAIVIGAVTAVAAGLVITGSAQADPQVTAKAPVEQRCADAGKDYQRANPENMGMDPAKLQKAISYWSSHASETVKVFRYNCLIGEGSLDPLLDRKPIWIRSHTKTLVSMVVGRAQTLGLLDIDDPIGKYIPKGLGDAKHRSITFRDLLTMRSGLHMNWSREATSLVGYDRVREAMSLRFDHEPGTYFEYAQIPMYLLPYATEHAVGIKFEDFAQKQLFDPLGIPETHIAWGRDRAGNVDGPGWNTQAWPNDFGRIGQLLLHKGEFNGQQIIDSQYLKEATTGTKENPGYGMPFWLNSADRYVNASIFARHVREGPIVPSAPRDMYMTWGLHGQHVFVIPSLNMVVTRSGNINPDVLTTSDPGNAALAGGQKEGYYTFFKLLMEAVTDKDMPEPKPFKTDLSLDIDPSTFVNPEDNLAVLGLGPAAAEGCTIVGCDGKIEHEGTVEFATDLAKSFAAGTGGP